MFLHKFIRISLLILLSSATLLSREIKGKVNGDDGDGKISPLPKATLLWMGTKSGGYTDKDGKFSLKMPDNSKSLIVSYTGYERDTIKIGNSDNYEIVLKSNLSTDAITVEGEQPSLLISKSEPIMTSTITKKGLQKAACCNLSESFQTNPSVDVSYSDALSGAKQIQLLGLQGIYIQMLSEKIPNFRGLASTFGLNYVPGPWMESIQISKGSASVSTGYESITGQINVEYKKPETSEKHHFNIYGDQYGRVEANLNSAYKVSDKISTLLFAHGNIFNNKYDGNNDAFLDKPLIKHVNIFNRWNIEGDGFEGKYGAKVLYEDRQGGQNSFYSNPGDSSFGIGIKTQRYEVFFKNGFIFEGDLHSSLGTIVSASYHKQGSFYGKNDYDGAQANAFVNIIYESEIVEEVHKYSVGFSFLYDNYDEKLNDSSFKRNEIVPGIYGEYNYSPWETLSLIGGLRADYHNLYGTFFTPRFHFKYSPSDKITIRGSAGKGYHVPSIFSENSGLLASSRTFITDEKLKPEEAVNIGINGTAEFSIFDVDFTLNSEFYRTDFINQVIVDLDQDVHSVHFYNLNGKSYSNSFQVDLMFEPVKRLEMTLAYRLNDVHMTINNELTTKPLISRHKAFMNIAYALGKNNWKFDVTLDYNGKGRLPSTQNNPEEYRRPAEFEDFYLLHAQITKIFGKLELYLGGENLTNFMQHHPIIAANQPYSKYFDSSMIWGPIMGRMIYFGARYTIN